MPGSGTTGWRVRLDDHPVHHRPDARAHLGHGRLVAHDRGVQDLWPHPDPDRWWSRHVDGEFLPVRLLHRLEQLQPELCIEPCHRVAHRGDDRRYHLPGYLAPPGAEGVRHMTRRAAGWMYIPLLIWTVFFLFKQLHLLDTQLGMILVYMVLNLPVVVWFMHSFINQVPLALEEAAVIDGCTRLQVLTRVVLPVSIPGLVATWLLAFSFAWNEFLFAVILTFNKSTTLPVLIQAQQTERGTAWWAISSIGLVSIIPMIVFAIILQRRIVTGLLGGSER